MTDHPSARAPYPGAAGSPYPHDPHGRRDGPGHDQQGHRSSPNRVRLTGLWKKSFNSGGTFLRGTMDTDQNGAERVITLRTGDEIAVLPNRQTDNPRAPVCYIQVTPREELERFSPNSRSDAGGNAIDEVVGGPSARHAPAAAEPGHTPDHHGNQGHRNQHQGHRPQGADPNAFYGAAAPGASPAGPTATRPGDNGQQHAPQQEARQQAGVDPAALAGNPATRPHHEPPAPHPETADDGIPF